MSSRRASFSLQQKVSLMLLAIMASMLVLSYAALDATVAPAFSRLEFATAEKNIVRAKRAIGNDLHNLASIVGDWAPWDDAYAYVLGANPSFPNSNLNQITMNNLEIQLLLVFDVAGDVTWSHLLQNGQPVDYRLLGIFDGDDPKGRLLIQHSDLQDRMEGLIRTRLGPMLLSSRPIITSAKTGPIAGTMIMGRFFDAATRDALQERTEVKIDWHLVDESPLDAGLYQKVIAADADSFAYDLTRQDIHAYGLLPDLFGDPLLILQATTPREISALGARTVNAALSFMLLAGIVLACVTWVLLRRIIVLPLERLARHITGIRQSGDLSLRLNESRADEIGELAGEFDKMTIELHDVRRQLLDQSFKAGKADTAAEVLHNIRNAMTPLINGIDRLSRNFRYTGHLRVEQATEELASRECEPERRVKLLQYIRSAFGHIRKTSEDAIDDLQTASRQARQVEAILSDQERYANVAPVTEALSLQSMIDEARLVIPDGSGREVQFDVQPGLEQLAVRAHRTGLVQVLGNLLLNAYESIQRSERGGGCIRIGAVRENVDDTAMVRLTIEDTGCGFERHAHAHIFQRGYSSKEGHQRGLGLHWCANALMNMSGRISAESPGAGLGASFHVLLPVAVTNEHEVAARKPDGRPTKLTPKVVRNELARSA